MILQARYVKRGRKPRDCDWCEKALGSHIYLYGAADYGDKPSALRLHPECVSGRSNAKIAAALTKALEATDA